MLHRADGVEGDAGRGHNGATGLGGDPRLRVDPCLAAGLTHGGRPLRLGRRGLPVDVGDTQSAADDQLVQAERGEERAQHLDRLLEIHGIEHLAADVGVQAHELDAWHQLQRGDGLGGGTRGDREAELGVLLPGADEFVGMGLDPGRHPDEHLRAFRRGRTRLEEAAEAGDLVERVHDDAADAHLERRGELVGRLVVAVQDEPIGRDAGGEGDVKLTT